MGALKNIRQSCAMQLSAGIPNKIWITEQASVTAIAAPTGDEISGASAFTMATSPAAGTWKVIEITRVLNKKSLVTTKQGDADTVSLQTVFTGFIPGIRKNSELAALNGCEWIAIVPDNNGNKFLLGDKVQGCTIDVGQQLDENNNGYPITITVERQNHYPYFLNSNVTITEAADA